MPPHRSLVPSASAAGVLAPNALLSNAQAPLAQVSPFSPEIVIVDDHRIACDGVGGVLGHPRVYLEMGQAHFVECPYCDRRFVLSGHEHREDERLDPAAYDAGDTPEA